AEPKTATRPALGMTRPATARISVLLPAPLGPSRPRHSPALSVSEMPSTAVTWPKRLTSDATSSGGAAGNDPVGRGCVVRDGAAADMQTPRDGSMPSYWSGMDTCLYEKFLQRFPIVIVPAPVEMVVVAYGKAGVIEGERAFGAARLEFEVGNGV